MSRYEILFNLSVLFLGFSESQLQNCSTVAYDGIKREVPPFTTAYQCSLVATVGFVWLSPPNLKYETL